MEPVFLCHLGAGVHTRNKAKQYKELLVQCSEAFAKVNWGKDGDGTEQLLEVLTSTSQVLESSPLTNTGLGSSLNINGQVESDSSILLCSNDKRKYSQASVCCSKQKCPITRAIEVLREQSNLNEFGITRPIFIVDSTQATSDLVTEESQMKFDRYKEMMREAECDRSVTDTIGIIIATPDLSVTASSSGGNMFKPEGRVGSAAFVGASHYQASKDGFSVVLTCSGNGEDIIAMDLCRSCCHYILDKIAAWDQASFSQLLIESVRDSSDIVAGLKAVDNLGQSVLYVGVFGLLTLDTGKKIVVMCHTTETFIVSYIHHSKLKTVFSSLSHPSQTFNQYEAVLV